MKLNKLKIGILGLLCLFVVFIVVFCICQKPITVYYAKQMCEAVEENNTEKLNDLVKKLPEAIDQIASVLPSGIKHAFELPGSDTPLHTACHVGNYDAVVLLLDTGANIDVESDIGRWTPLVEALCSNSLDKYRIANLLLDRGANYLHQTTGNTKYDILTHCIVNYEKDAKNENLREEGRAFFDRLLNLTMQNEYDYANAYLYALNASHDTYPLKQLIQNCCVDVNHLYVGNYTGLTRAAMLGDLEMVRFLLNNGADKTMKDKNEKTAYEYAVESGRIDIAELLAVE